MGRVPVTHSRPASTAPGAQRHKEQTNSIKKDYKIVFEEIAAKKKPLITLECSTTTPPRGYTFVAAGNPKLTLKCKEFARRNGEKIYVVSTTKHKDTQLSTQVHRVGYHFPSITVSLACEELGLSLSDQGTILNSYLFWPKEAKAKSKVPTKGNSNKAKQNYTTDDQDAVDIEARQAIKDLFPAMPEKDLKEIIRHAFDLQTRRVGAMINDLPLPRRVQLAVVAHIRHMYTDYDKLLKKMPYQAARSQVETSTLEKLAEWRGDDKDDPNDMEDILREVIVIPDEDEDETDPPKDMDASHSQRRVDASSRHSGPQAIVQVPGVAVDEYQSRHYRGRSIDSDEMLEATAIGNGQYILDQKRGESIRARHFKAWEEVRHRVRASDSNASVSQLGTSYIPSTTAHHKTQREPSLIVLSQASNNERPPATRPPPMSFSSNRYSDSHRDPPRQITIQRHSQMPDTNQRADDLRLVEEAHKSNPKYVYEPLPSRVNVNINERDRDIPYSGSTPGNKHQPLYSPADVHGQSAQHIMLRSPQETVLPSIEPATPTSTRFSNARAQNDSDVVVLDSPFQNNKRRRLEEGYDEYLPKDIEPQGSYNAPFKPQRDEIRYVDHVEHRQHGYDSFRGRHDEAQSSQSRERPYHNPASEHLYRNPAEREFRRMPVDTSRPYQSSHLLSKPLKQPVPSPKEGHFVSTSLQHPPSFLYTDAHRVPRRHVTTDPYVSRPEARRVDNYAQSTVPSTQPMVRTGDAREPITDRPSSRRAYPQVPTLHSLSLDSADREVPNFSLAEERRPTISHVQANSNFENSHSRRQPHGNSYMPSDRRPVIPIHYPDNRRLTGKGGLPHESSSYVHPLDIPSEQNKQHVEIYEDESGRIWDKATGRELIAIRS